jgi:hypothetical protein
LKISEGNKECFLQTFIIEIQAKDIRFIAKSFIDPNKADKLTS